MEISFQLKADPVAAFPMEQSRDGGKAETVRQFFERAIVFFGKSAVSFHAFAQYEFSELHSGVLDEFSLEMDCAVSGQSCKIIQIAVQTGHFLDMLQNLIHESG